MKHISFLCRSAVGVLSLMLAPYAIAQQHPAKSDDSKVAVVNSTSVNEAEIYREFEEIAPKAFNIPNAPRFAIVGKDSKFYLGIGGVLKGTGSFDFGDPIDNANEFTTSAINMNPTPGNGGLLQMSAQQSSFFINFIALPGTKDKVGVYFNGNFLGQDYGFVVQYAYIKYRGFTVGYDYSLFTDVAAGPPTIDYEGPNAFTAIPNVVLDYRHSFNSTVSAGLGLELPQASYTNSGATYTVNQRVPDIPAYLQFAWDGGNSWIRFSALLRNILYRDVVSNKNRDVIGWGVKASGSAQLGGGFTAYYQGAYGKGMTSYFQDLNGCGMDLTPDADKNGKLQAVEAWGAYGGLQYNFNPNLYVSGTYSQVRTYADKYAGGATSWDDQYRYAQYVVGNLFYNINSTVTWGIEYIWGRRVDFSGLQHHDNRIQTMLQVSF